MPTIIHSRSGFPIRRNVRTKLTERDIASERRAVVCHPASGQRRVLVRSIGRPQRAKTTGSGKGGSHHEASPRPQKQGESSPQGQSLSQTPSIVPRGADDIPSAFYSEMYPFQSNRWFRFLGRNAKATEWRGVKARGRANGRARGDRGYERRLRIPARLRSPRKTGRTRITRHPGRRRPRREAKHARMLPTQRSPRGLARGQYDPTRTTRPHCPGSPARPRHKAWWRSQGPASLLSRAHCGPFCFLLLPSCPCGCWRRRDLTPAGVARTNTGNAHLETGVGKPECTSRAMYGGTIIPPTGRW